jgi:phosphatidylglycerol---prolipoprotein diacylglyceryl transferase
MAFPYLTDLVRVLSGLDLPLPVPMFGLMVAAAFLVSIPLASREVRRLHETGRIAAAPREIVGELAMIAVVAGLVGARIFHILEHPQDFVADPWSMIFSRSGFSMLGGLVFGTIAGAIHVRRRGLPVLAVCDGVAPALMLGYAVGRIGCQISGDGDWGIPADMALKPGWLPAWLWAQTYDNNIFGVAIAPPGVYPTPIYETLLSLAGFGILLGLRKRPYRSGWLFALYLLLSGIERFFIERIRVNPELRLFGVVATQAQIVSVVLIAAGIVGLGLLSRRASARGS